MTAERTSRPEGAMPEWPAPTRHFGAMTANAGYERARYEAAMARLRVAVEALERLSNPALAMHTVAMLCNPVATNALTAIGPLPPLPKERP